MDRIQRTWIYVLQPADFGIAGCKCGNFTPTWSEWQEHLWCSDCEIDFIPESNGIFDGPILVHTYALMGIFFDRFNLLTQKLEPFDTKAGKSVGG